MKRIENDSNAAELKKHMQAIDTRNVFVSYSGNYRKIRTSQVHNSCELLFVEQGAADYRIGGKIYPVKKGSVLIIGSHDHHESDLTEVPYIRYGLTVMTDYLQRLPMISQYMNVYRTPDMEHYRRLEQVEEGMFRRMTEILKMLYGETGDNGKGEGELVYALLLELTLLLKRILRVEKEEIGEKHRLVRQIRQFIDLHYQEDLSLNSLSRRFFVQPNTISRSFGGIVGEPISAYINAVRITNAVYLLEHTGLSVTELAGQVGYESVNTFLRQFKRKMGISPLQYRKQYERLLENQDLRIFKPEENGDFQKGNEEKFSP